MRANDDNSSVSSDNLLEDLHLNSMDSDESSESEDEKDKKKKNKKKKKKNKGKEARATLERVESSSPNFNQ